jgi:hypothetical protein
VPSQKLTNRPEGGLCSALPIDATIFRNTIQIIGLSIFNGLFLVYAVIQVSTTSLLSDLGGLRSVEDGKSDDLDCVSEDGSINGQNQLEEAMGNEPSLLSDLGGLRC